MGGGLVVTAVGGGHSWFKIGARITFPEIIFVLIVNLKFPISTSRFRNSTTHLDT